MELCLRQFVLVEGRGVEEVRACAERLRTKGAFEAHEVEVINRLEQVALLIAERYLPLIPTRGQVGTELEFQILGEELEALAASWEFGSLEWGYATHNAATCFAQVNGDKPDEQVKLNTRIIGELQRNCSIHDDTAEALLLRKVIAGMCESGNGIPRNHAQVTTIMIRYMDPDTLGRMAFLIRRYIAEGSRDSARRVTEEARQLLGMPERFKPGQVESLRTYLDSLS